MMKGSQIRELSEPEMIARVAALQEELFRLRFRGATEALNDPLRLRVIRRDIARLKTVQHEQATAKAGKKKKPSRATKAGR